MVFVDEAAEDVTALDIEKGAVREGSDVRPVGQRQVEVKGTRMWAGGCEARERCG